MRYVNFSLLNESDTGNVESDPMDCNQIVSASFHVYFNDVIAEGTVKLQASNDICDTQYLPSQFTPTEWVDIPNQSASITAGASALLTIPQMSYRWVRVVFTNTTPGESEIVCNVMALGL